MMSRVLKYDSKYKMWYTQEELLKKVKESKTCSDIEEDLLKLITHEIHGSPRDDKIRFFFQTQHECWRIADGARVQEEA